MLFWVKMSANDSVIYSKHFKKILALYLWHYEKKIDDLNKLTQTMPLVVPTIPRGWIAKYSHPQTYPLALSSVFSAIQLKIHSYKKYMNSRCITLFGLSLSLKDWRTSSVSCNIFRRASKRRGRECLSVDNGSMSQAENCWCLDTSDQMSPKYLSDIEFASLEETRWSKVTSSKAHSTFPANSPKMNCSSDSDWVGGQICALKIDATPSMSAKIWIMKDSSDRSSTSDTSFKEFVVTDMDVRIM